MLDEIFEELIASLSIDQLLAMVVAMIGTMVYLYEAEVEAKAKEEADNVRNPTKEDYVAMITQHKRAMEANRDQEVRPKRLMVTYDRERTRKAIHDDYWGSPNPIFNDKQFERVFRVSRAIATRLLEVAGNADPFFRESTDALGRTPIAPTAKILIALKMLAYGTSGSAFVDYFQMGKTTAQLCYMSLVRVVSNPDGELSSVYLRNMTRSDARKASALHNEMHGVAGMIGSLDCMHVVWRCCPKGWQGQYSGKEGSPTIVLEAMADYNLWFWHAAFGFPGTLNDINIWDQSAMLKSWLDGSFVRDVDFSVRIGNKTINKLFVLVDGIYPDLSRFVKTVDEAIGRRFKRFAGWQESARKDIERAFGVIQRKFHVLVKPMELWHTRDITSVVYCCIVLHNMMVEKRVEDNELEMANWYENVVDENEDGVFVEGNDLDEEAVARRNAERELRLRLERAFYDGNGVDLVSQAEERRNEQVHLTFRQKVIDERWNSVHDKKSHYELRECIMQQLDQNSAAHHPMYLLDCN